MIKTTAAVGAGFWLGTSRAVAEESANDKLNVACIGIGGRGSANVGGVSSQNMVALCDVDEKRGEGNFKRYPNAKKYKDFRRMLDEMDKQIDAVVISTPDHTHFHPAMMALQMGKPVYCEKPLAHTAWECRQITETAKKMDLPTQLGNQRHAYGGMRRIVEAVRAGVIGDVKEVYCFIGGSRGMPGMPTDFPAVPSTLDWDLWLGPAKERPYSPAYCPYNWRFWWDFGTGEPGNWGCHILDIPFWALQLQYPKRVDLDEVPEEPVDPQRTPKRMRTRLEFGAEPGHGPLTLHWWHGSNDDLFKKHGCTKGGNTLFIGTKGVIGADFNRHEVVMNDGSTPEKPEETIPSSPGFHKEWINACKGGPRATCDFVDYTGALAESVLLANAACRAGGGFDWDAKKFQASGNGNVEQFIVPEFRKGWEI